MISTTVVSLGNEDLGRIINGRDCDPPEARPFTHCFAPARVMKAWSNIGAVPLTRNCLGHEKVRAVAGGAAPEADRLAALQVTHDENVAAARARGLNAGVFAAAVPTHSHIARAPTAVTRVQALVDGGVINPGSMWVKTGAVAINGWQALSAHDGIVAAEAKAAAAKALAKAEADLIVITKAEAVAAKGGVMSGADITVAVRAVFVAVPGQTCTRSSLAGKQQGAAFLAALPAPWTTLLPPARVACQAAAAAAAAATDAADAAAAAAVADHQPPAAPSVVAAGAVTAATVDVASMSSAERRELLAKLGGAMGDE